MSRTEKLIENLRVGHQLTDYEISVMVTGGDDLIPDWVGYAIVGEYTKVFDVESDSETYNWGFLTLTNDGEPDWEND